MKTLNQISRSGGRNFAFGLSRYVCPINAILVESATEAFRTRTVRTATTVSRLYVRVTANTLDAAAVVTLRKNGANATSTVSIGAGLTGEFRDDVNSDAFSAGDTVTILIDTTTPLSGTLTISLISTVWEAANGKAVQTLGHQGGVDISTDSATGFWGFGFALGETASEAQCQVRVPVAGTVKNLFLRASANGRTTDTTFRVRVNGANTSILATFGSGVTGLQEDTSNIATVAAGDLVNLSFTTGSGGGTLTIIGYVLEFESDSASWCITAGGSTGVTVDDGITGYLALGGEANVTVTEANVRGEMRVDEALTANRLRAYVVSNATTGSSTIRTRKNGANGGLSVTIGAGATGVFTDSAGSDALVETDEYDLELINGAGGAFVVGTLTVDFGGPTAVTDVPLGWVGQWPTVVATRRRR